MKKAHDQDRLRREWQTNAARLQTITERLRNAYANAKGGFAVGRYEELKKMIKECIQAYRQTVKDIQNVKLSGTMSSVAARYDQSGGEAPRKMGLAARLKQTAQSFALHDDVQPPKDYSGTERRQLDR